MTNWPRCYSPCVSTSHPSSATVTADSLASLLENLVDIPSETGQEAAITDWLLARLRAACAAARSCARGSRWCGAPPRREASGRAGRTRRHGARAEQRARGATRWPRLRPRLDRHEGRRCGAARAGRGVRAGRAALRSRRRVLRRRGRSARWQRPQATPPGDAVAARGHARDPARADRISSSSWDATACSTPRCA